MNRKTIERNMQKYDRGLRKRLMADRHMENWDEILEEAKHHIVKINLPTRDL